MSMKSIFDLDFDKFTEQLDKMQNDAISKVDLQKAQNTYEKLIREAADVRVNLEKSNALFADYLITLLDGAVETLNNVYESFKKKVAAAKKSNPVADIVNEEVKREVNENHGKVNCKRNEEETCECKKEFEYPSSKLTFMQRRNVESIVDEYMNTMILPHLPAGYDDDIIDDMHGGLFEFAAWILNK